MLIPKQRLYVTDDKNGEKFCTTKYYVWDSDECGYIENKIFSYYDTKEECQKAIDFFNSFSVVRAS